MDSDYTITLRNQAIKELGIKSKDFNDNTCVNLIRRQLLEDMSKLIKLLLKNN